MKQRSNLGSNARWMKHSLGRASKSVIKTAIKAILFKGALAEEKSILDQAIVSECSGVCDDT